MVNYIPIGGANDRPAKGNNMKLTAIQQARYDSLMQRSKKEVFAVYCNECLGRIHNASCAEQNKSWMAYDVAVKTK
jgi:hypothetical protein